MAQTAAAVAVLPPMGALQPPTVIDCILCDHGNTLTLFNHFFQEGGLDWLTRALLSLWMCVVWRAEGASVSLRGRLQPARLREVAKVIDGVHCPCCCRQLRAAMLA
jgi:hypothetical protein